MEIILLTIFGQKEWKTMFTPANNKVVASTRK